MKMLWKIRRKDEKKKKEEKYKDEKMEVSIRGMIRGRNNDGTKFQVL